MKHKALIIATISLLAISAADGFCATVRKPVTPNASKEAQALLAYICSIQNDDVVRQAVDWWKKGGIPTIMWHWGAHLFP